MVSKGACRESSSELPSHAIEPKFSFYSFNYIFGKSITICALGLKNELDLLGMLGAMRNILGGM